MRTRIVLLAVFVTFFLAADASIGLGTDRQPNVILLVTDDQGYGDLHSHGNSMIQTPNLDRLHDESVRLTNFHVDPTCSPTRAALMTGRYSTRTGVWHTIMGRSLMYHDEVTMADVFAASNYRTGIFGKWHLGGFYPMRPQDRGFQEVLMHGDGGITTTNDFWGNTYFNDTYWHNGKTEKFNGYCTDVFFDNALQFIEQSKHRPFFVYLATNAPHMPFNVADHYSRPYRQKGVPEQMANFYGMITNIDENVGRLRSRLKEWKLEENTILIFMSDNGTAIGFPDEPEKAPIDWSHWYGFNAGMHGIKGSEYDGGHRVPCFLYWPGGGLSGGREISALTAHIDVLPTLIDLCRLKRPDGIRFDGASLASLISSANISSANRTWPDRTLFVHSQRIEYPSKWRQSSVMTDRWRLVNGKELYDMTKDPSESQDVAQQYPGVVVKLRAAYEHWWVDLLPRFNDYGYIVIGSDKQNPSLITCQDWHAPTDEEVPWNQEMIKSAPNVNGYWVIEAAQSGRYEFTLRQQPVETNFPIQAAQAELEIGDVHETKPVPPGSSYVKFVVNLKTGKTRMQTWLTDEKKGISRGAFFVYVQHVD